MKTLAVAAFLLVKIAAAAETPVFTIKEEAWIPHVKPASISIYKVKNEYKMTYKVKGKKDFHKTISEMDYKYYEEKLLSLILKHESRRSPANKCPTAYQVDLKVLKEKMNVCANNRIEYFNVRGVVSSLIKN